MSSLPQGWHGIHGLPKPTSSAAGISGSSVPVIIRKKWNSPQSNIPQTRLPSYKSSNLRTQNCNLNGTYRINPPVTSCPVSQTKVPSPSKPSPVKEYQNEVAKLKKELSTVKAENSILKAKVRRVDDDNLQKERQIEKMRVEIKALQKNEPSSSKKSKESQELLLLRQKCLRLESALKDKDLTIKKLSSEASKSESNRTSSIQKQICQVSPTRQNRSIATKSSEKESISAKSSQSRANVALKTEVTKLRDMIHKLEKENQDLQQQAKLHCQEIRRLKVQMKNKDRTPLTQTSMLKSSVIEQTKPNKNSSSVRIPNSIDKPKSKPNIVDSFTPRQRLVTRTKSPFAYSISNNTTAVNTNPQTPPKSNLQKSSSKIGTISRVPNGTVKRPMINKQTKDTHSKLPVTRSGLTPSMLQPVVEKAHSGNKNKQIPIFTNTNGKSYELDLKIQEMRENIAAKKIQRSWRQHQKSLHHSSTPEPQNGETALTFIFSSLKHHKSRKDKMNFLVKKKNLLIEYVSKEVFMEPIESIKKRVWEQEFDRS